MIICEHCGALSEDGTYFCEKCGKLLATEGKPNAASNAGAAHFGETAVQASGPARMIREYGGVQSIAQSVMGNIITSGMRTGKLVLYSDRIEFVPGALNLLNLGQMVIPIKNVVSVDFRDVMMMPLGAEVKTRDGASHVYMFMVSRGGDRKHFVETAREVMAAANGGI
jgi:hypothetical protein